MKRLCFGLLILIVFLLMNTGIGLSFAYPIDYILYDKNGNALFPMAAGQLQMHINETVIIDLDETYYICAKIRETSAGSFYTDSPNLFNDPPVWNFNIKKTASVPEPATILLVGSGMIALAGFLKNFTKG